LGGYPPPAEGVPAINFTGQLVGAIAMVLLGFIPAYVVSWILKQCGILRVSDAIQNYGIDNAEIDTPSYPEFQRSQ
jgi:ammonia channel protein AmtB